jgi:hypothetical protein
LVLRKGVYHLLQDGINASRLIDPIEKGSPFCPRVWSLEGEVAFVFGVWVGGCDGAGQDFQGAVLIVLLDDKTGG